MEKEYKLNPEIKEQFDKLNFLIEQEVKKSHEDTLAEAIRDTWGDELKSSKGYDMLEYAATMSKTTSERARYSLEEAFHILRDEEAFKLANLYQAALSVTDAWYDEKMDKNRRSSIIYTWMMDLKKSAEEVCDDINTLWKYRSSEYREEIEELKSKLREAS